ncbi:MAG TPA: HAMP domain-containing sensor histidine kinase [Bryobacteraceae bacterium]|nr:HAMP domain-containing sensor histidine kinase [Bryobacteraceae bacterium]
MHVTRYKRQVFLFLAAILVPAAVLVGLASRILYQDRELAAKRAADQRRLAVDQLRRELDAHLEAIKLQEINRLIRSVNVSRSQDSDNPAVIFTASAQGDRLVFSWETAAAKDSPAFARHRREGEAQEFIKKDYAGAAAAYDLALAAASGPIQMAEARLLLARSLAKAGKPEEAAKLYQALLNAPPDARDEQGVGYRFYAADRLLAAGRETAAVLGFLRQETNGEGRLTLPELYMIRPLLGAGQKISERIAEMEQAAALAKDFARVRARIESGGGSAWVPYGSEPWLVTLTSPQPPLPGLLLAVSSTKVSPPGVKLRTRAAAGDVLGDEFPGLRVEWSDSRFLESVHSGLPIGIRIAGLALVLGVAVFGGYLLLRDVNRDVRMNEVRSQFVASVSHELKTPLTAIRMFAETLAMGRSRDERTKSEYLETIVNESERLARLVDNVLDFSKIEQGKKIYRLRPTRLEEVAGSAARAMQFPLAQQGFQLHLTVQDEMPGVQADPDAIQQAILNLLTNAMKYSGGAREIDLRLGARNGDAVIEVVDHGLGMAPDERERVFEKFYRAPSHESRLIAGTGLGLTLVAHIAQAHGGRVEVESAPGAGSTFCIFIPVTLPGGARA